MARRLYALGWAGLLCAALWGCDDGEAGSGGALDAAAQADAAAGGRDGGLADAGASDAGAMDLGPDAHPDAEPDATADAAAPLPFEPWLPDGPRPADERLCPASADPAAAPDPVFIECALDGGRFAAPAAPTDRLRVLAYNIERGFDVDAQLARLLADDGPRPDVVLLTEADRGCARTGGRHITAEYAEALGMDFAYATEFVELTADNVARCEHGNAVLSRYPLGNVRALRHASQEVWFGRDENRLGGRVAVVADVQVAPGRLVRVYALHLESPLDQRVRGAQAAEVAAEAPTDRPVVAGGDLNSGVYIGDLRRGRPPEAVVDLTAAAFLQAGFVDAHAGLPVAERITHGGSFPLILDLLFVRGLSVSDATVGDATWDGLSDHQPVWAEVALPAAP